MPPALTPRDPLTVVAKQGTEEMATTVQVGAFKTLLIFFTFLRFFLLKKKNKQTNKQEQLTTKTFSSLGCAESVAC